MIILFSSSLGLTAVKNKRKQIEYIEQLIYIGGRVSLLMGSTMPETAEIHRLLREDNRLRGFDFSLSPSSSPLNAQDRHRVSEFLDSIGLYDAEGQQHLADEFTGYFKMLKKQYQDYYNSHYRLYIAFGIFSGILVSVLLV